jgi:hypothetical protein
MRQVGSSWLVWAFAALAVGCADVFSANPDAFDGGPGADRAGAEVPERDTADEGDIGRQDATQAGDTGQQDAAGARAGYTRCRELECDNRDQRCVLCPDSDAVCAPLSGVLRCDREGALFAYCDGDEDCAESQRCEWRMGDTFASMICVPTNGRACNGFCGEGCGSACQRDEDCDRVTCGRRCVSPAPGGGPWPGFGRCR